MNISGDDGFRRKRLVGATFVAALIAALPVASAGAETATCGGREVTIFGELGKTTYGTPGDDVILGALTTEFQGHNIEGLGGNDYICTRGGEFLRETYVRGGDGDDWIEYDSTGWVEPGRGHDVITNKPGSKTKFTLNYLGLHAGIWANLTKGFVHAEGRDAVDHPRALLATSYADVITGSGGPDLIDAGRGDNIVDGKGGRDNISGEGTLRGGDGRDVIDLDEGNGTVYGDGGDDFLRSGYYHRGTAFGGSGTDMCIDFATTFGCE